MSLLHEAVEEKKFDVRMVERNVARGVLSQEDADKVTKKLQDDGENAEWVSIESLIDDGQDAGQTSH